MPEPRLITSYLQALSGPLPAGIVEELADGLAETLQAYLDQGLETGQAAEAALAEFGAPDVIIASFTRNCRARVVARRLLLAGPAVGACWAAALITGRAWEWPVPAFVRVMLGLALIATIGLLATAALSTAYRRATRAGIAGCATITALDTAMITGMILAAPSITWLTTIALAASAVRAALAARALRPASSGR